MPTDKIFPSLENLQLLSWYQTSCSQKAIPCHGSQKNCCHLIEINIKFTNGRKGNSELARYGQHYANFQNISLIGEMSIIILTLTQLCLTSCTMLCDQENKFFCHSSNGNPDSRVVETNINVLLKEGNFELKGYCQ